MEAFLLGEMRMTERAAGLATAREIQEMQRAWSEAQHREWERTRWLAWQQMMLSPNIKKTDKPRTPKAFMRFPWERDEMADVRPEDIRVTPEQVAELNRIFEELRTRNNTAS